MISLRALNVRFRSFALRDINLDVASGDYLMLVGPTGAGKTVLLETIAGLNKVNGGDIWIDDQKMTFVEPERRNIGVVYQDCALFPHLSVAENIVFGLRVRRTSKNRTKEALTEIAALVGVEHLLDRKPAKLSGGEKQKVALARALATKPRLLLLDEPLGALDPQARQGLQRELKRIHGELGISVIHVTHDFDEALALGRHIAVVGEGSIRQVGAPGDIFRRPNSEFVARFTMMRNILPGQVVRENEGFSIFRSGAIELATTAHKPGATYACIRPDDVSCSSDLPLEDVPGSFSGRVTSIEDTGMGCNVVVDVPPEICCLIGRRKLEEMELTLGSRVKIRLAPGSIHLF